MNARRGQSLIEILIASGIGAILLVGALSIITPALRGTSQGQYIQVGSTLARDLLDSVRSYADANWPALYSLSKGSTRYFVVPTTSPYTIATGTESIVTGGTTQGLIGYWKLDESSVGSVYNFATSTGTGTATNSPTATSSCRIGDCWYFNGASQYVDISGNPSLFQISTGTISAWIKTPNASTSIRVVVAKNNAYGLFLMDNEFGIYDWGAGSWRGSGVTLNDNQWHHILCAFQGGVTNGTYCYIDGILRLTTTMSIAGQSFNVQIGTDTYSANHFTGYIDDVRIYNRMLTADEVKQLYEGFVYQRYFTIDNVGRDGGGNIIASGGGNDPSTQRITATYITPRSDTRALTIYLTRSQANAFWQSDWSGGSGLVGPTSTIINQYASSTNIDVSTSTGSVRISL